VLLVGMMALSAIAEKAGFFDWAASLTARAGGAVSCGSMASLS